MADKAFALSPISASGVSPTDDDYAAISEAFMETARGRWFLQEYAKRNRNADTGMVLEAVSRIERTLAAERQPSGLADTITAVRAIIATARTSADMALAHTAIEDQLAPMRRCARIIKEIAWGLRESGADGRICSLLDMQVDAISNACDHMAIEGVREGVIAAFDMAERNIAALETGEMPIPVKASDYEPVDDAVVSEPAPSEQTTELAVIEAEPAPVVQTAVVETPIETMNTDTPSHDTSAYAKIGASLGASLLASGIVAQPVALRGDPLAPIRRMSAAEKIAFFS